jgi:light-regulated signal transduction histidine kinase (bacteriophytochrome)
LKYSKPDVPPVITITSRRVKGSEVAVSLPSTYGARSFHRIEVSDNGIGFEQQYAEQIFKMFQRLHGKAEYSGTGVGLPIARKVVENHQGYIWAEGEVQKGATFSVLLPAE